MWIKERIAYLKTLPIKRYALYTLLGLFVLGALIFSYNRFFPKPPITETPQILPSAPQAAKVEYVYIKGPVRWRVYKKDDLAGKIPLSPAVSANPQIQITATAAIPPSPYGGTAAAFGNISTGVFGIDYTQKKRPLLGFGGKTEIGALGGVSTRGDVAVIYAGQPIIRIGPVDIGVAAGGGVIGGNGLVGGVVKISGNF